MSTPSTDPRIDRLYALLPAVLRLRDADQGYPLQALLRVIAEQVNVVEDDIARLYRNWFIEPADDWAVAYIADLIGYVPLADAGQLGDETTAEGRALNRLLIPRREVANTIRYRRRKGTLAVLESLANDVAGWPALAVENFKLLARAQNIDHLFLHRSRLADVREVAALGFLGTPFDRQARTVDLRDPDSQRTVGRFNIPAVTVFVWRLRSYPVTQTPTYHSASPECYNFSVLGHDTPLAIRPNPGVDPIAAETAFPGEIRRLAFDEHKECYYGADKSLAIWAEGWANTQPGQPIPASAIIPADLTDWTYEPAPEFVAVDPVLGRFRFPQDQLPRKGVSVTYQYLFSADMGGGEYTRALSAPADAVVYQVGAGETLTSIVAALEFWVAQNPKPAAAVIEIVDNGIYDDQIVVTLAEGESLQIRAAQGRRPVVMVDDRKAAEPGAITITLNRGSAMTLDGLLVTGSSVHVTGPADRAAYDPRQPGCGGRFTLRHCTIVPGWNLDCDCEPTQPFEPGLEFFNVRASVCIAHSILGSIQVHENETAMDPIPIRISDSIIDAVTPRRQAVCAAAGAPAYALLTIERCTVFGIVEAHAIALAEDSIFSGCVNVARRQLGCMRFCYVPPGCRTPRRYHCQPDLVVQEVKENITDPATQAAAIALEQARVQPQFGSVRYGYPTYARLAETCAVEITTGARDESEMGVFHDLFEPQRQTNLLARLQEYTPAGLEVGIVHVT